MAARQRLRAVFDARRASHRCWCCALDLPRYNSTGSVGALKSSWSTDTVPYSRVLEQGTDDVFKASDGFHLPRPDDADPAARSSDGAVDGSSEFRKVIQKPRIRITLDGQPVALEKPRIRMIPEDQSVALGSPLQSSSGEAIRKPRIRIELNGRPVAMGKPRIRRIPVDQYDKDSKTMGRPNDIDRNTTTYQVIPPAVRRVTQHKISSISRFCDKLTKNPLFRTHFANKDALKVRYNSYHSFNNGSLPSQSSIPKATSSAANQTYEKDGETMGRSTKLIKNPLDSTHFSHLEVPFISKYTVNVTSIQKVDKTFPMTGEGVPPTADYFNVVIQRRKDTMSRKLAARDYMNKDPLFSIRLNENGVLTSRYLTNDVKVTQRIRSTFPMTEGDSVTRLIRKSGPILDEPSTDATEVTSKIQHKAETSLDALTSLLDIFRDFHSSTLPNPTRETSEMVPSTLVSAQDRFTRGLAQSGSRASNGQILNSQKRLKSLKYIKMNRVPNRRYATATVSEGRIPLVFTY